MSLDDSELENDLTSLPASREPRWEQIYVDGDTKLVQRGGADIDVHDFAIQEPKEICITTPPGEMESSFMTNKPSDDTPLSFSALMPIEPIEPQAPQSNLLIPQEEHHRGVGSKASFSDRVHQMAQEHSQHNSPEGSPKRIRHSTIPDSTTLADLEHEVDFSSSVSTSTAPSRVGTGFSIFDLPERTRRTDTGFSVATGYRMPLHQDSGFAEPERISYESERIRHSLDESIRDLQLCKHEKDIINGRLWDETSGTLFGEGVRGEELQVKPITIPAPTSMPQPTSMPPPALRLPQSSIGPSNLLRADAVENKSIEEKNSNTTIRPPSILIPDFHHTIPKAIDAPLTPPKTGALEPYSTLAGTTSSTTSYHEYLEATRSRSPSPQRESTASTSDLDDYLSHSISFAQHGQ